MRFLWIIFYLSTLSQFALGDFYAFSKVPSGAMSDDKTDSKNSLYTQISQKPFTFYIAPENDFTGAVKVDIVDTVDDSSCHDENLCNSLIGMYAKTLNFSNEPYKPIEFTIKKALLHARVRMRYKDSTGANRCSTSIDVFSVRPESYEKIELKAPLVSTDYIGGKDYEISSNATTNGIKISNYKNSVNITLKSNFSPTCPILPTSNTSLALFENGKIIKSGTIKTQNIGPYQLLLQDDNWTKVDQIPKSDGSVDCIKNSHENTPNNGKIGCNIYGKNKFVFVPKAFRVVDVNLTNHNKIDNFTYIADTSNNQELKKMSAVLSFGIEAVLDYNDSISLAKKATAYDKNCSAKDVSVSLSFINSPPLWNDEESIYDHIRYSGDGNKTTKKLSANKENATFLTSDSNFTKGRADVNIRFNFDKNITKPLQPFEVFIKDFNITNIKDENISSTNFTYPISGQKANFYFGRVWSYDVSGISPIKTSVRYEVFCDTFLATFPCQKTHWINLKDVNPKDSKWHLNINHTPNDGKIDSIKSPANPTTTITRANPNHITNGAEKNVLLKSKTLHLDTIEIEPSSWLRYNLVSPSIETNDFRVEFLSAKSGAWAGQGELGFVVDKNISKRKKQKVQW